MKRLLFVSPAVPRPTGGGLRMRAWLFLRGLSEGHRITLVAGSPNFPAERATDLAEAAPLFEESVLLPFSARRDPELLLRRLATGLRRRGSDAPSDLALPTTRLRRRLGPLRARDFDLVHVLRSYMLPVAWAALDEAAPGRVQLDVDEGGGRIRRRLAALAATDDPARARRLAADAAAYDALEGRWLPRVGRVLASSDDEAEALGPLAGGRSRVTVVENAVALPAELPPPPGDRARDLLLVGSLGYEPNEGSVRFVLGEVLPRLRAAAPGRFRLVVAGGGARPPLRSLLRTSSADDVAWVDAPPVVEPLYADAVAALAPLRARGGTRVKVLEAVARGRPLVATAAAVEGLPVTAGEHYLRAEDADEWARALVLLLDDRAEGARLVERAWSWVRRHGLEERAAQVAALARQPLAAGTLTAGA